MRTHITVPIHPVGTLKYIRAIVRGELALHVALRLDGRVLNQWAVTCVRTGQQILVMRGPAAGRAAFRLLSKLSFEVIDDELMRQCNIVVRDLRERGYVVLYPQDSFTAIREPEIEVSL